VSGRTYDDEALSEAQFYRGGFLGLRPASRLSRERAAEGDLGWPNDAPWLALVPRPYPGSAGNLCSDEPYPRRSYLTLEHGDLMAQDTDLGVLGAV
jgi:hypothetical protein